MLLFQGDRKQTQGGKEQRAVLMWRDWERCKKEGSTGQYIVPRFWRKLAILIGDNIANSSGWNLSHVWLWFMSSLTQCTVERKTDVIHLSRPHIQLLRNHQPKFANTKLSHFFLVHTTDVLEKGTTTWVDRYLHGTLPSRCIRSPIYCFYIRSKWIRCTHHHCKSSKQCTILHGRYGRRWWYCNCRW